MDIVSLSAILAIVFVLLLLTGVWIGFSLIGVALIALMLNNNTAIELIFAGTAFAHLTPWSLISLPLFIWMGELLYKAKVADDLFNGLSPLLEKLPGGHLHINVFGSGIFAALSGSSAATAATIGRMTIPELKKRGYNEQDIYGSLAGSATLGLLIPPSIILIVYGVAADISIADLFIAGILPGLILLLMFSSYIAIRGFKQPKATFQATSKGSPWLLLPIISLIVFVISAIYFGIATPSESAALGIVGSFILIKAKKKLSFSLIKESLINAAMTSAMILLILLGASFVTIAMGFLQLPATLATWIASLELSTYQLLFCLTLAFIILGLFLDGISIIVLTAAILLPIVELAGIDLIWFGIYLVIVVEISQITPPIGFNLFVLKSLTNASLSQLARACVPYFLIMLMMLCLLVMFPQIITK
ncbi:TRAP transporter large permease [Pseudoalteromonas sp. G4]|uniref:TRAP transporter large permease n=1 Tax=Pseudoalteromonas sp. G4 TaxID=2992761 RepID=UPI00237D9594|nr:TRAP transporter large permease subunit [Pseudoalteromonas sp. G4]MDE3274017.1 TRAP transporter large permease subunit [Pseudoalteromonas sp. G4]